MAGFVSLSMEASRGGTRVVGSVGCDFAAACTNTKLNRLLDLQPCQTSNHKSRNLRVPIMHPGRPPRASLRAIAGQSYQASWDSRWIRAMDGTMRRPIGSATGSEPSFRRAITAPREQDPRPHPPQGPNFPSRVCLQLPVCLHVCTADAATPVAPASPPKADNHGASPHWHLGPRGAPPRRPARRLPHQPGNHLGVPAAKDVSVR